MFPALHNVLVLSCGLLASYRVSAKKCDKNEIEAAMMACQEQREALSDASLLNNHTHLCQALQVYASCIEPEIVGCKGKAVVAFQVIKQTYMDPPYNCKITELSPGNDHVDNPPVDRDSSFVGVSVAMMPTEKPATDNMLPLDTTTHKPEIQQTNTAVSLLFAASHATAIALSLALINICLMHVSNYH